MRGALRVAALAGVVASAACTSLLGDFTAGPGAGSSGSVGASPHDGGTLDGGMLEASRPTDAEAGPSQLSCSSWRWPEPLTLEDLAAGPTHLFSGRFTAFPGNVDEVRVVAAKNGSTPFSVYTVSKGTMLVQQIDAPSPEGGTSLGFVQAIHHISSARGGTTAVVVAQHFGSDAGPVTSLYVTAFDDLMPSAGPLPAPFTMLAPLSSAQSVDNVSVLPFSTTDIFEAVSLGTGNPATYTLGVARVSPTAPASPQSLTTVAASPNADDFSSTRLLHTNGNVYIYSMNDSSTPGSTGWTVPDTGMFSTMPAKQTIAAGADIGVVGMSPNESAMPAADVLMLEQDFSGQFTSGYKYFAGMVNFTSLSTWMTSTLTQIRRTTSPFLAPVFNQSPAFNQVPWFNDNAMMLGPGLRNGVTDAGPLPGLNLLWVNSAGGVRADQSGADGGEILTDRPGLAWASAVPARISDTSAAWDVVWVETVTNEAGAAHHVLRMNELQCH